MTYDADITGRQTELRPYRLSRSIVIERHDEHGALALRQPFQTVLKAFAVEGVRVIVRQRGKIRGERIKDPFSTSPAATAIDHDLTTHAQNERGDAFRFANGAGPELP